MLAKKIIMYSTLTLVKKYVSYLLRSDNGKGHGVHSPFVYTFIKEVLNNKKLSPVVANIEQRRKVLEVNNQKIQVWDRGAGSRQTQQAERTIRQIAKAALKPKKYSQLLHKIVAFYKPTQILEMGTSLGVTTCYLAVGNPNANLVTLEGAPNVATIAKETFQTLGLQQIKIMEGDFKDTLPQYLHSLDAVGLAYVDGNHKYAPTMEYFNLLVSKAKEDSILIFDDIHWSAEMEKAWLEIKASPEVTLTIDLFFIGLVFVRKAQKEKEHFTIRY
jgi:predicted O-methyltransferase YrrM